MSKTTKTTQKSTSHTGKEKTNWVLIPIRKENIIKDDVKWVLFNVDGVASAVISKVFLRKKEWKDKIFLSIPETFEVTCRVREQVNGRYVTTKEYVITAKQLFAIVRGYNDYQEGNAEDDEYYTIQEYLDNANKKQAESNNDPIDDLPDDDLPF